MRTWIVKYWKEMNDVATDFEEEIVAADLEAALVTFKEQRTRYRIESIIEQTNK